MWIYRTWTQNLLTEESCIIHQIKENLFVFLFLKLVFPISIYRKIYIRNSKCWLKNRYGARRLRYNWRGIEALIIINDILRKSKSMESFSFIQGFVLCTFFSLFSFFLYKYRIGIILAISLVKNAFFLSNFQKRNHQLKQFCD